MHFASIRDFRLNASQVLGRAGTEDSLVVTRRGKPVAVLVPTDEGMLEEILRAVQGARLRAAVELARKQAQSSGAHRLTLGEINSEIRKARRRLD